jgi:hypothetical protein
MSEQNPSPLPKMDFLQKVKYGGAVGKKSAITIVALIVLGVAIGGVVAIAIRIGIGSALFAILILASIGGLALLASHVFKHALGSIDKTLKDHPELALMDGSEYVSYQKALMAAKHITVLPAVAQPILDPEAPVETLATAATEESEEED